LTYPDKPVRLVEPFGAGGGEFARFVEQERQDAARLMKAMRNRAP
jgi:tripartite-type tricarboxylate transporter receptor subunit TctC